MNVSNAHFNSVSVCGPLGAGTVIFSLGTFVTSQLSLRLHAVDEVAYPHVNYLLGEDTER